MSLIATNLEKSYGSRRVVSGISVQVSPGEAGAQPMSASRRATSKNAAATTFMAAVSQSETPFSEMLVVAAPMTPYRYRPGLNRFVGSSVAFTCRMRA